MSDYAVEIDRDAQGRPVRLGFVRQPERPAERVLDDVGASCAHCGRRFEPNRPHQRFCRDGCRLAYFKARQASLPLSPEPIRVAVPPHRPKLVSKLKRSALQVLGLLGDMKPHSRHELAHVGGARYSARVGELRDAGHVILGPAKSLRHSIYDLEPAGPGGLEMYRLVVEIHP